MRYVLLALTLTGCTFGNLVRPYPEFRCTFMPYAYEVHLTRPTIEEAQEDADILAKMAHLSNYTAVCVPEEQ